MNSLFDGKVCTKCKTWKEYNLFSPAKIPIDGRASWCKQCGNSDRKNRQRIKTERLRKLYPSGFISMVKVCRSCGLYKLYAGFARDSTTKDGYYSSCKLCKNSSWRSSYKVHRQKIINKSALWTKNNRQRVNNRRAERSSSDPLYRAAENIYRHNRRARKLSTGTFSAKEWVELCNRFGNKCICCNKQNVKLTQDHIKPIVMGGPNTIDNIQPLCLSCNSRKHAKWIDFRHGLVPFE